jgi:cytochrome c biogenesis protein CcmG/thiol:disulfide interchange protein DsbE
MKTRFLIPFGLFSVLIAFLAVGLTLDPREVPSPLIDKTAPSFELPTLKNPAVALRPLDMQGKVWLLNVWASWCTSCRAEHEVVKTFSRSGEVAIIGLNYKDNPADARRWLDRYGDPYQASVSDEQGLAGIDWGVYGVPETFVIDKRGIIRYKQTGPLTREILSGTILPLVERLKREKA